VLDWLYTLIAGTLALWHAAFSTVLPPAGGAAWALAIAFLVLTVRSLLFPLFVSQLRSQRAVQALQPEIQALREQHGDDKQAFSTAVLALQRDRGVNPLAGCLPALLQLPVFIALLHVLRRIAPGADGLYSWSDALTDQAAAASLWGVPISSTFGATGSPAGWLLPAALAATMGLTLHLTQRYVQRRSGPVTGPAAQVQGLLLYGLPLGAFASGFFFPVGVLLYWTVSNLFTLGQQVHLLRRFPPPAPGPELPTATP